MAVFPASDFFAHGTAALCAGLRVGLHDGGAKRRAALAA